MDGKVLELETLVILVVVVVASFGVSLLLGLTCWNSLTRHQTSRLHCQQCLHQPQPHMAPPPLLTGPPFYSSQPVGAESHTADQRLGLIVGSQNPSVFQAPVLSHSECQSPAGPGQDVLDRNTILSRSFRSSLFQSQSSPLDRLVDLGEEREARQTNSRLKLSQVRVLTSPPASQPDHLLTSASRTPATARLNTKRKTLMSNLSRKSLKSVLGGSRAQQVMSPPATSETNLETETSLDEEVFLCAGAEKGRVTNIVEQLQGQLVRRGSSAASDWRDPRKGRRLGSPGRTGKAEYFKRQEHPSVPIELEEKARTELVCRQRLGDRRSVASAPQAGGARPKTSHLRPPSQRRRERTEKYTGYSESDVTDFTSDEEARKQKTVRRLELPGRGEVSPLSSSCGDVSVTPPPPASPRLSPLQQYSLVSLTPSDIELIQSSAPKSSDVGLSSEAGAGSLTWDNYPESETQNVDKV